MILSREQILQSKDREVDAHTNDGARLAIRSYLRAEAENFKNSLRYAETQARAFIAQHQATAKAIGEL